MKERMNKWWFVVKGLFCLERCGFVYDS